MSSPLLLALTALCGTFTIVLGLVHIAIPRLVGYGPAIGRDSAGGSATDSPPLGTIGSGGFTYRVRRNDLVGLAWVMSNAASYVLITIGIVDLAWVAGWRGLPIALGATWIAGWWATRAASQFALGRRAGDVVAAAWFAALAVGHLVLAFGAG